MARLPGSTAGSERGKRGNEDSRIFKRHINSTLTSLHTVGMSHHWLMLEAGIPASDS